MDEVTEDILNEFMVVDVQGTVDMSCPDAVQEYAMKNKLLILAGWLSWNGEHHHDRLIEIFNAAFNPRWADADETIGRIEADIVKDIENEPRCYVRGKIRPFGK